MTGLTWKIESRNDCYLLVFGDRVVACYPTNFRYWQQHGLDGSKTATQTFLNSLVVTLQVKYPNGPRWSKIK